MKNLWTACLAGMMLMIGFTSCDKEDVDDTAALTLNFTGLENLGNNYQYEGWIMVNGAPVTTGTFTVDDNGNMSTNSFDLNNDDLEAATAFILTIEPMPDNDPAPSDVHILAGDFSGANAMLTVDHNAALGNDFTDAMGQYILATPTNDVMDDEFSGVWWLDPAGPSATLDLPTLPAGWEYEGWAVINGSPVTTGKFTSASGADDAAPFSGNLAAPPFPGEDFLMNAPAGLNFPTDLRGGMVVISIEPVPDNSDAPFTLKPLVGMVEMGAAQHTLYGMSNNANNTNPTGMASR